jgi:hypothetical protein
LRAKNNCKRKLSLYWLLLVLHADDRQPRALLVKEHAKIQLAQVAALAVVVNLTLNMDGWSSKAMASWYGCTATTPSREVHVLAVDNMSEHTHNMHFLAGQQHTPNVRFALFYISVATHPLDVIYPSDIYYHTM